MASKGELQRLNDAALHQIEQARAIQNGIKKLNAARKDSDVKQQQQALLQLLHTLSNDLKDFQNKAAIVQQELEAELGGSNEELQDSDGAKAGANKKNDKGNMKEEPSKKRLANPEDQEIAYHLKACLMPKIYSQNSNLQAELILRNRRDELRAQRKERQVNYNRETNLSAKTTLQVIAMHERKARAAEARADALQAELDKLQGGQTTGGGYRQGAHSADDGKSQVHLNNITKKNQQLIEENQDQRREIQRLKQDNAELIKKAKHAEQDRHQVMSQLSTSEMARKDLYTRLQRQKAQHDRLSKSLTRQSSDWIETKKQQNQDEEEERWRNVGHAAPHGSYERTYSHPAPRNVDQPRYMYPVDKYAQPTAA